MTSPGVDQGQVASEVGQPRDGVAHRCGRAGCSSTLQVGQKRGQQRGRGPAQPDGDRMGTAALGHRWGLGQARRGGTAPCGWRAAPADSAADDGGHVRARAPRPAAHPGQRWTAAASAARSGSKAGPAPGRPCPGALSTSTRVRLWRGRTGPHTGERAGRDLSPQAGQLACHQVVVTGVQPTGDHQKRQERAGLPAGGQPRRERQRGP